MPFDRSRYPPDWEVLTLRLKAAAGWRCQRCKAPHNTIVTRVPGGFWSVEPAWDEEHETWYDKTGQLMSLGQMLRLNGWDCDCGPEGNLVPTCRVWNSKVVLTTAHIGPNRHNKMDCSSLEVLCQSCHLSEDHADHIAHARQNRMSRKAAGSLFELEGTHET